MSTCAVLLTLIMLHVCVRAFVQCGVCVCVTRLFVTVAIWAQIDASSAKNALHCSYNVVCGFLPATGVLPDFAGLRPVHIY